MSYSLAVYLIDLDELRAAVASERVDLLDLPLGFQDHTGELITLSDALRHVVYGTCREGKDAYLYGIALECLAERLGERLDAPLFETTRSEYLEQVYYVLPLVRRGPPVRLPPWRSFPYIGFLAYEECLSHEEITLDHADQEVRAGRFEFSEWVEAASAEKKGLLGFWA